MIVNFRARETPKRYDDNHNRVLWCHVCNAFNSVVQVMHSGVPVFQCGVCYNAVATREERDRHDCTPMKKIVKKKKHVHNKK